MVKISHYEIVFYPAKIQKDDPLGQRGRLEVTTWFENGEKLAGFGYTDATSLDSLLSGPRGGSSGSDEHEDG